MIATCTPLCTRALATAACTAGFPKPLVVKQTPEPGEPNIYENPLHDSVPHTPAREAHQDQHRTRDGGDRRCPISQMSWNMSDQDPRTRQRQGYGQVKTRGRTGTRTRPDLTFKDYPLFWGRYRTASATWKQKPGSPTPRSIARRPSTDAERTKRTSASSLNGLNSKPLGDLVAWRRGTDDQGNAKPLGDYSGNDPEQMHSRTDNKTKRGATDSDSNFMSEVRKDPLQHGQGNQDRDQDRGGRVRTISQVHSMEEEARQTDVSGKVVRKIQKLT